MVWAHDHVLGKVETYSRDTREPTAVLQDFRSHSDIFFLVMSRLEREEDRTSNKASSAETTNKNQCNEGGGCGDIVAAFCCAL